ncbi:MAG: hypothetical protein IPL54_06120 [Chitinophagaceae bacterium]|nr:hypothetical protein [Chitinophagaceae bacterium]
MTVEINKKTSKKDKEKLLRNAAKKQMLFNAKKFLGKLEWKGDPLTLQQGWRNE